MRLAALLCLTALAALPALAQDTVWRPVSVGGGTYRVAIAPDRSQALVAPAARASRMTTRTVERAARAATGCRASVERVTAMATGGRVDEPINMSGKDAILVRLQC